MCWACEQERFWTDYAKFVAARQADHEASARATETVAAADKAKPRQGAPAAASPSRSSA